MLIVGSPVRKERVSTCHNGESKQARVEADCKAGRVRRRVVAWKMSPDLVWDDDWRITEL
jgi:hypothetical protein